MPSEKIAPCFILHFKSCTTVKVKRKFEKGQGSIEKSLEQKIVNKRINKRVL